LFRPGLLGWHRVFRRGCRRPKGPSGHDRFRSMRFPIVMALPRANCGDLTSARRPSASFCWGCRSSRKQTSTSIVIPARPDVSTERGRRTGKWMVLDTPPASIRNGGNLGFVRGRNEGVLRTRPSGRHLETRYTGRCPESSFSEWVAG
jgi:hypothetical protein